MQIVTDSGTDAGLVSEHLNELNVHVVPLIVTLAGATYREGIDIAPGAFYERLEATGGLPVTSQPSAGDFAAVYRRLAATDPHILSIHISSGLSGTLNAARAAVELVPEANVTLVDTKTLSAPAGWQVVAAARAVRAGWPLERVLALLDGIRSATDATFTLKDLKYLIHGGRISHMKGLLASILNIKPMIGVEKERGTYVQLGQARTFKGAVRGLVDLIARRHAPGSALRAQVIYAGDPEAGAMLRDAVDERFDCTWLPMGPLSLVLGAHTGPSMVGVACAPEAALASDEPPA
jgi:DegV family protein with EDD domain